ncbi:serine/threonine protein kinase [Corynebacterium amycolatum]|uniref:serine/threonine protein kinase n=1 Tax=Corynebacterium amycolatum TaxID=43765 RepID=UPI003AF77260
MNINPISVSEGATIRRIATGGQATVEEVEIEKGKRFARKRVHLKWSDIEQNNEDIIEDSIKRFEREIQILRSVQNPYVIELIREERYRYPTGRSVPAYCMPLADDNLDGLIRNHLWDTDKARALGILCEILVGIACLHNQGILHRDLKPTNILIVKNSPKLCDFGLSKNISQSKDEDRFETKIGVGAGTVDYTAPEQFHQLKNAAEPSDIFSFGAIAYKMITGKTPEVTPTESVKGLDSTAPEIAAVIEKCLEYNPKDRYQSAVDCLVDLDRAVFATQDNPAGPRMTLDLVPFFDCLLELLNMQNSELDRIASVVFRSIQEAGLELDPSEVLTRSQIKALTGSGFNANGTASAGQHLLFEMVDYYQQRFVDPNIVWSYADRVAEFYGKILSIILSSPSWDFELASGEQFSQYLTDKTLEQITRQNRFDAARTLLGCFTSGSAYEEEIFKVALDRNPAAHAFIRDNVHYDYMNLPKAITALIES